MKYKAMLLVIIVFLLSAKTADAAPPAVSLISPINGNWNSTNDIVFQFQASASSPNALVNAALWTNSSGIWGLKATNTTKLEDNSLENIILSDIEDGTYVWNINVSADSGEWQFASPNFTLKIDATIPSVVLDSPSNNSYINAGNIINFTITDSNLNNVTWGNSTINNSFFGTYDINTSGFEERTYNITVYANDSAGNSYVSIWRFIIDNTAPAINITSPLNKTYFNDTFIDLDFTANETANACWYQLDKNGSNSTIDNCANGTNISVIGNGAHNLILWVKDAANNVAEDIEYFTISCTESWSYASWGSCSCSTSRQTRNSTELNSCGTAENKSATSQACTPTGCTSNFSSTENMQSFSISKIEADEIQIIKVSKEEIGITEISIDVKNEVENVEIVVKRIDSKPSYITQEVSGKLYQYIEINATNLNNSNTEKVTIKFKVDKSWISSNDINEGTIALNKYATKWNKLPTTKNSEDYDSYYYESESSGFSIFAITGNKNPPAVPSNASNKTEFTETEEAASRGISKYLLVIFAAVILIGAVVMFLIRGIKTKDEIFDQRQKEFLKKKTSKINPKVYDWALRQLSMGYTKEQIRTALIRRGYSKEDAEEILKSI